MFIKIQPTKQIEEVVVRAIHKTLGQKSFIYCANKNAWYSAGQVDNTNALYANLCNSLDYTYHNTNLGRFVTKPLGVKMQSHSLLGYNLPIKCSFNRAGHIVVENMCENGFDEHTSVYHSFVRNITQVLQSMQIKYEISDDSN